MIEDDDGDDPERCSGCGCFICICNDEQLDPDDDDEDGDWYGGSISLWDPPNDEEDET